MVEQKFIDKIEQLRLQTYSHIANLQKDSCPMYKSLYMNYQFEYWYDGYKHILWEDNTHLYAVNELPYCYDNELKNTTFMETLDVLVNDGKIWPFLLFIDGKVVPWSWITVIHDYDYTYLKIKNITENYSLYTDFVMFPLHCGQIRYGEDNDILTDPNRKGFYFTSDRLWTTTPEFSNLAVRLEILDSNIYYKQFDMQLSSGKILEFTNLPDGYIPTKDNILTFTDDGLFNHDGPINIEDTYHGSYGLFTFQNDTPIKYAVMLYNTKNANKEGSYLYSKSDLHRKSIYKLLTQTSKETSQEIWNDIVEPLIKVFDFDHTFGDTYESNITKATSYITKYDFALWKDVFTKNLRIKSITYTGTEFRNLADTKGYVRLSRKHSDLIEDVAIVFVNSKLYDYMMDITYTNNTINIPVYGIIDEDHVEILLYTECNNNILDIKVVDAETSVYIHPEYNLEDCEIMSTESDQTVYDVLKRDDGRTQYIVDRTYTMDEQSNYKITFTNPFFYNKNLKIVPKRQFRYYRFRLRDNEYKLTLPTQFNYCHNMNQYLVFVNGKKLDRTEFTITVMNENRPFDKLILYLPTILDSGDNVDVFYIPEQMIEKYKKDEISTKGLLLLEDSTDPNYPTTYPLSKSTSMVFINGLKVNPREIKDISLNCLLIDVDKYERYEDGTIKKDSEGHPILKEYYINAIDNVTIDEYISGNTDISQYLGESHSDAWKELIKVLLNKYATSEDECAGLSKIFGNIFAIEDPEESYKDNLANLRSVLYDIVLDHYLNNDKVITGDKFVYDFEREYWEPNITPDTTDVVKDITLFPTSDKLLDYNVETNLA